MVKKSDVQQRMSGPSRSSIGVEHRLVADQPVERRHDQMGPVAQPLPPRGEVALGGLDIGADSRAPPPPTSPGSGNRSRRARTGRWRPAKDTWAWSPSSQASAAEGDVCGANACFHRAPGADRLRRRVVLVRRHVGPGERRVRLHGAGQLDSVGEGRWAGGRRRGSPPPASAGRRRCSPLPRRAVVPDCRCALAQATASARNPVGVPVGSPRSAALATEMPSSSPIR